jgi:hypothetical protein
MPLFFLMLLGMVVYAGIAGDMGAAIEYLTPRTCRRSRLTPSWKL